MTTEEALNQIKNHFDNIHVLDFTKYYVSVKIYCNVTFVISYGSYENECFVANSSCTDFHFKSLDKAIEYIESKLKQNKS